MLIETYKHGDRGLWAALGPFLVSREVHRELGGPIYSTGETRWLVAFDVPGQVIGFVSWRETKTAIYYDYGYVVPGRRGKGVFARLAKARDKGTAELGLPLRTIVRLDRWRHYRERGWKEQSRRGAWVHAVKEAP